MLTNDSIKDDAKYERMISGKNLKWLTAFTGEKNTDTSLTFLRARFTKEDLCSPEPENGGESTPENTSNSQ